MILKKIPWSASFGKRAQKTTAHSARSSQQVGRGRGKVFREERQVEKDLCASQGGKKKGGHCGPPAVAAPQEGFVLKTPRVMRRLLEGPKIKNEFKEETRKKLQHPGFARPPGPHY